MPKNISAEVHQKQKKRYYKKHRVYNKRHRLPYDKMEEYMIYCKMYPDVQLAKRMKRSLAAIQIKRQRILKKRIDKYGEEQSD
jgi:hypothetical protein